MSQKSIEECGSSKITFVADQILTAISESECIKNKLDFFETNSSVKFFTTLRIGITTRSENTKPI